MQCDSKVLLQRRKFGGINFTDKYSIWIFEEQHKLPYYPKRIFSGWNSANYKDSQDVETVRKKAKKNFTVLEILEYF